MGTILGTSWYNHNGEAAYYDKKLTVPYGKIEVGDVLTLLDVSDAPEEEQVLHFTRVSSEGAMAELYLRRQTSEYGRKVGTEHPHCEKLLNHTDPLPDGYYGWFVVTVESPLRSDRTISPNNIIRVAKPGEVFAADTEIEGWLRGWYNDASGVERKFYFKRLAPLAQAIGGWQDRVLVFQPDTYADVPVEGVTPPPPPPPPPEGQTWWQKFLAFLKAIWDWIVNLFT